MCECGDEFLTRQVQVEEPGGSTLDGYGQRDFVVMCAKYEYASGGVLGHE